MYVWRTKPIRLLLWEQHHRWRIIAINILLLSHVSISLGNQLLLLIRLLIIEGVLSMVACGAISLAHAHQHLLQRTVYRILEQLLCARRSHRLLLLVLMVLESLACQMDLLRRGRHNHICLRWRGSLVVRWLGVPPSACPKVVEATSIRWDQEGLRTEVLMLGLEGHGGLVSTPHELCLLVLLRRNKRLMRACSMEATLSLRWVIVNLLLRRRRHRFVFPLNRDHCNWEVHSLHWMVGCLFLLFLLLKYIM